jgi:hypothetical protein
MSEPVRVVREDDLVDGDPTPGMHRQVAFEAPSLWAGLVHTDPGATSGWHHHGDHETSLYVVAGTMRLEFGAGGAERADAGAGEFIHVPAWTVHRDRPRRGRAAHGQRRRPGRAAALSSDPAQPAAGQDHQHVRHPRGVCALRPVPLVGP